MTDTQGRVKIDHEMQLLKEKGISPRISAGLIQRVVKFH